MITTIEYKYGFEYKGVKYGWKNKKLFRLPFTRNKRTFKLKEIPQYVFKTTCVYNIQRDKITILKLKGRTVEVNWSTNITTEGDCPF
jgi:hypothetical protein|tara:strand:+ start:64 stop:324 length:261 start_codon:yes stop_codon:yes gene_type:complete